MATGIPRTRSELELSYQPNGIGGITAQTQLDHVASIFVSGAELKVAYEAEANTNAYTDTEKTKLAGIEAGAKDDQSDAEIKTAYENNADTNAFTNALLTKLDGIESLAEVNNISDPDAATLTGAGAADALHSHVKKAMASFTSDTDTNTLGIKSIYRVPSHTGDVTLTISSADIATGSATSVWEFTVKDTSGNLVSNGRKINIVTEGAETIDGVATVAITADYGVVRLFSDGSNLFSQ